LTEEEMGVSHWSKDIYSGFTYIAGNEESGPQLMCSWTKRYLTAHLSHRACLKDFKHGRYPIVGVTNIASTVEKRAEAAQLLHRHLKEYAALKDSNPWINPRLCSIGA
jgi:hypothetical protein